MYDCTRLFIKLTALCNTIEFIKLTVLCTTRKFIKATVPCSMRMFIKLTLVAMFYEKGNFTMYY